MNLLTTLTTHLTKLIDPLCSPWIWLPFPKLKIFSILGFVIPLLLIIAFVVYTVARIVTAYKVIYLTSNRTTHTENPTHLNFSWILLTITSSEVYRYPSPPPNPNFVNAAAANPPVNVPVVPPVIPNVAPPMPEPISPIWWPISPLSPTPPPTPPASVPNPGIPGDEIILFVGFALIVGGLAWLQYKYSSKEKESSLLKPEHGNGEYAGQLSKITTVNSCSDIDLSVIPFIWEFKWSLYDFVSGSVKKRFYLLGGSADSWLLKSFSLL